MTETENMLWSDCGCGRPLVNPHHSLIHMVLMRKNHQFRALFFCGGDRPSGNPHHPLSMSLTDLSLISPLLSRYLSLSVNLSYSFCLFDFAFVSICLFVFLSFCHFLSFLPSFLFSLFLVFYRRLLPRYLSLSISSFCNQSDYCSFQLLLSAKKSRSFYTGYISDFHN